MYGSFFVVRLEKELLMEIKRINNSTTFTNAGKIGTGLKIASKVCAVQEGGAGLSNIKFIQDSVTGLLPKMIFARSKADFGENTFLELAESILVYYCPALFGEKIFRKIYTKNLPKKLKSMVSTPAVKLLKTPDNNNKKLLPVKAALALSGFIIPLIEFTLNYLKNLITLKVFKQANFENIANLKVDKTEKPEHMQKVQKSAITNIKRAIMIYGGCLGLSGLLLLRGHKSKILQNLSELILAPGTKLFKNNKKKEEFFNKFFSIDFDNNNGKLAMSRGQLTSCVLVGGAGYFGAAKDRGKQNFLETLFRYPIVGLYIIYGNELLEKTFRKLLYKNGKCKDVLNKKLEVPKFADLENYAKNFKGNQSEIYKKLLKQKVLISEVPLLFGIGVMGFFITKSSNLFTKFRYNRENRQNS